MSVKKQKAKRVKEAPKVEIEKGGKVVEISSMVTPGGMVHMRVSVMTGRGEVVQTMELT